MTVTPEVHRAQMRDVISRCMEIAPYLNDRQLAEAIAKLEAVRQVALADAALLAEAIAKLKHLRVEP